MCLERPLLPFGLAMFRTLFLKLYNLPPPAYLRSSAFVRDESSLFACSLNIWLTSEQAELPLTVCPFENLVN